jgi:hypothetical protein
MSKEEVAVEPSGRRDARLEAGIKAATILSTKRQEVSVRFLIGGNSRGRCSSSSYSTMDILDILISSSPTHNLDLPITIS